MMLFDLQCEQNHRFEGWFNGNAGFESQVKAGLITCPYCHSQNINKAPMAPRVLSSSVESKPQQMAVSLSRTEKEAAVYQAIRHVQEVLEQNSTDVGSRFAEEARKIHYGETEQKNIRGTTTAEEAKELKEEGIEFLSLPKMPKLDG